MEDNEQQQLNSSSSFNKKQHRLGIDKLQDMQKKKKKIIKILKILANPITWKILLIIGIVAAGGILLSGFLNIIMDDNVFKTNSAKKDSVSISMSSPSAEGSTSTPIVIRPTNDNGSYEITTKYDEENIEDLRKELEENYSGDLSDFSDFEIGVLAGLEENGLDLDSYTSDELKCLPKFLKAESCTQFLDLRPNDQKFDASGNYMPRKMNELGDNEVPGTILVQRTNTGETIPTTLEYKKLEDFNALYTNNDISVKNYFTIDDSGNLVIAKWDNKTVTVNGDFPEEISDEEKVQNENENIINLDKYPYTQYVKKYTMPFDFLVQLLVITEDPEFCLEIADIVLDSEIVINIQEEETITTEVEKRTYDVHKKEEKYIDYEVAPSIEAKTEGYFLNLTKDDEGNDCTTYKNEKTDVEITTVYTSHTYSFEIIEADTWIAHYKKTYKPSTVDISNTTDNIDSQGEYETKEEAETKKIETVDSTEILNDNEVKQFKEQKEKEYKDKIPTPLVSVQNKVEEGKKYKKISITPTGKFKTNLSTVKYEEQQVINEDGSISIVYNMPSTFTATSIKSGDVPAEITFVFRLNKTNYTYWLSDNTKDNIKCNISKLKIVPYCKINLESTIETNTTKYISDSTPVTNTHIYAKDDSGKFEKFLKAYDENKKAVELMRDIDLWLFEMMEENENTIDLIDTIKYLLYVYDGTDYGVTELDSSIFNPDEFISVGTFLYGDTIEDKVWFFLKSYGYSDEAVAGVMGNIYQECRFDPNLVEVGSEIGFGLCQWSYGRRTQLENYAKSQGKEPSDVQIQLEFLLAEMTQKGPAKDYSDYQFMDGNYNGKSYNQKAWENASSVEEATIAFEVCFERAGKPMMQVRIDAAERYYNKYKGQVAPSTLGGGTESSSMGGVIANTFTSTITNRTYTIVNQTKISGWNNRCDLGAQMIITSAYYNGSIDNLIANTKSYGSNYAGVNQGYLSQFNLKATKMDTKVGKDITSLRNQISNGGYALYYLKGSKYTGKSGMQWNISMHWVAIIGYRVADGKEQIYVGTTGTGKSGWYDIDEFANNRSGYISSIQYVNEK